MKRFVVAAGAQVGGMAEAVTQVFAELQCEWWGWIPGFWLVVSPEGSDVTMLKLRDALVAKVYFPALFVGEVVKPGTYGGVATENREEQVAWLQKWWSMQPDEGRPG
jgi:hypothetical protein